MNSIEEKGNFRRRLGMHIRKVRNGIGVSLKEFEAKDGSIDRHMMSKIETGNRFPTIYTLYKISKILGVTMSQLFRGFK